MVRRPASALSTLMVTVSPTFTASGGPGRLAVAVEQSPGVAGYRSPRSARRRRRSASPSRGRRTGRSRRRRPRPVSRRAANADGGSRLTASSDLGPLERECVASPVSPYPCRCSWRVVGMVQQVAPGREGLSGWSGPSVGVDEHPHLAVVGAGADVAGRRARIASRWSSGREPGARIRADTLRLGRRCRERHPAGRRRGGEQPARARRSSSCRS